MKAASASFGASTNFMREIGNLLPNNQRQRHTCCALCHILYPVEAALTRIFRLDSNSTSYEFYDSIRGGPTGYLAHEKRPPP